MENSPPEPLPKNPQVAGTWRGDQEVAQALADYLYGPEIAQPFSGEIPLTPERAKQLAGLGAAFTDLGKDLGLDVSARIPAPEAYHFFDNKESFDAALHSLGQPTEKTLDAVTTPHGIFIVDRGDDFTNVCVAAHETVHYLSQKKIGTGGEQTANGEKYVQIKGLRGGYEYRKTLGTKTFHALDEMATDLTYLDLLNSGYWDRQPDLPKAGERNPVFYASLDIIGEELILTVAKHIGTDPLTLLRGIETDVFTGKSEGLRILTDYIQSSAGTEATRELIHAPPADPKEKFVPLATALNLPGAVARIQGVAQGKPAGVLKWVRARRESTM